MSTAEVGPGYVTNRFDFTVSAEEAAAFHRLWKGLNEAGVRLADGRTFVNDRRHALQWLLQQIGAEYGKVKR